MPAIGSDLLAGPFPRSLAKEYSTQFDEYLQQWIEGDLDQEQLARAVVQLASGLHPCIGSSWSEEIKQKLPNLLAGIFALFTIIRSGAAYQRHADAASRSTDVCATESPLPDAVNAQEPTLSNALFWI